QEMKRYTGRYVVNIIDAVNGRICSQLESQTNSVLAVSWSSDGSRLISAASYGNTIHVWDVAAGQERHRLNASNRLAAIAWSPDGNRNAAGTNRREVRLLGCGRRGE